MIVFHTSNIAIPQPDVLHSRKYLDFGQGFYVTPTKMPSVPISKSAFSLSKPLMPA